jgi:site-specific DNA-methyltransferase (adenine-specific)
METNKIYQGDCLELMKELEDNSIDLVITSPPYDNLRDYQGYSFEFEKIAKELDRVIKNGGVIVWVMGDATINGSETGTSFKQALFFKEIGLNLYDTMIWAKTKMPQNHDRYEQGFEYMFIFSKGKPKTFNGLRDKKNIEAGAVAHASYRDKDGIVKKTSSFNKTKIADFGLRTNIWFINPCLSSKDRNGHPAPFPEQLANDQIISWSKKGDLILDPMCGSGTTCKMALLNERKFIGIDICEEYCKIANSRIQKELSQTKLENEE